MPKAHRSPYGQCEGGWTLTAQDSRNPATAPDMDHEVGWCSAVQALSEIPEPSLAPEGSKRGELLVYAFLLGVLMPHLHNPVVVLNVALLDGIACLFGILALCSAVYFADFVFLIVRRRHRFTSSKELQNGPVTAIALRTICMVTGRGWRTQPENEARR